jgi:phosphoglycolate phosphatase-like HAD superfamily hydrolase
MYASTFSMLALLPAIMAFYQPLRPSSAVRHLSPIQMAADYALLFDCDGVIVETEELHRLAYNEAFTQFDLKLEGKPVSWSVEYYDILQNTVGGGKPKMMHYFNQEVKAWPTVRGGAAPGNEAEQIKLVDDLQDAKTEYYKVIVEKVAKARPGVLELMDEAIADPNLKVMHTLKPTLYHRRTSIP